MEQQRVGWAAIWRIAVGFLFCLTIIGFPIGLLLILWGLQKTGWRATDPIQVEVKK